MYDANFSCTPLALYASKISPLLIAGPFESWHPNPPRKKFDWEGSGVSVPKPYNFRHFKRAAIVKLGYGAFVKGANEYFQGVMKGEVGFNVYVYVGMYEE